MFCTKCGNEAPDGANACTNCGALLTASAPGGAQAAPPGSFATPPAGIAGAPGVAHVAGSSTQFSFDFNRLSLFDRVTGIATLVLLISLFLPWVHFGGYATINGAVVDRESGGSWNGFTDHGYFWIVFILCLAVLAFLIVKAGLPHMPFKLPVSDDQAMLIVTGISFVLVLIGFLLIGSYGGDNSSYSIAGQSYTSHYGVSRSFGAYVSILAALVAVAPLAWPAIQQRMNKPTPPAA